MYKAERAVEIFSEHPSDNPSYGTGYRLTDKLVLTVKHLFKQEENETCKVRANHNDTRYNFDKVDAKLLWWSKDQDVALLEITGVIPQLNLSPVQFGRTADYLMRSEINFQMYGYPGYARVQRNEKDSQGGRDIVGIIRPKDTAGGAHRYLILRPSDNVAYSNNDYESWWAGMSGAAIFYDHKLISVQAQHPNPDINMQLEAERLDPVFQDEDWQKVLTKFGVANYGENNISFTSKDELLAQLKTPIAGELQKLDSVPVFLSLKDVLNGINHGINPNANEHDVACMICDYVQPNSLIKLIDDVLQPAIDNVKVIQQASSFSIVDSAVNKTFRELLRLLLPLSLDDYLEMMQNERADNAHQIYKFAVTTPLGVEIMVARIQDGRVSLSHGDTVQSISGVGAIPIDNPVFAGEKDAKIVSKVLIELWKKVLPEERLQETELTIREKNRLSGVIQRRKKSTNHYCISSLAEFDFDRFKSLAALLCEEIPSLSAIAYGGLNNNALMYFEDDLIAAISELTKNLEREFPSGSV